MNPDVDKFLKKSELWQQEISTLRAILLAADLEENLKWAKPCYSYKGINLAIIQPFKKCLGMMFFKGTLLKDPKGILVDNGPNSQAGRRLEFNSVQQITKQASTIRAYIAEAIAVEESGQKVVFKKNHEPIPEELALVFSEDAKFKKAFYALTPGRQRAYILHFSSAKQPSTRHARIVKFIPFIMAGKGISDR